jgi:hypothetical protein
MCTRNTVRGSTEVPVLQEVKLNYPVHFPAVVQLAESGSQYNLCGIKLHHGKESFKGHCTFERIQSFPGNNALDIYQQDWVELDDDKINSVPCPWDNTFCRENCVALFYVQTSEKTSQDTRYHFFFFFYDLLDNLLIYLGFM